VCEREKETETGREGQRERGETQNSQRENYLSWPRRAHPVDDSAP